jgi:uncharacterized protein (DUF885 family)
MLNRREALALSGSALALSACAAPRGPAPSDASAAADARLDALLTRQFEAGLDRNPEAVTNLGLDKGPRAAQRARLADRSPEAAAADRTTALRNLAELKGLSPRGLSADGRLNYDVAEFRLETDAGFARRFAYHSSGTGRPGPYVVNQIAGAYFTVPDFLDTQHPVETAADADAYLQRLSAFAGALDGDTARVRENASRGVVAPDFVIDKTLGQLRALRDGDARDKAVVRSLARRAAEKSIPGDHGARAQAVFEGPVRAALTRQIDALQALRPQAVHTAGVQRLPDGDAYYAQTLRSNTTTAYTADDVHRIGLEQVRDLQSRIDALLRTQGYTQGSVGERLNVINKEPRFVWPNTDEGRAGLLTSLNQQMAEIAPLLPRVFSRIPKAGMEIRRVPPAIEQGAPGGYAQAGSLDGTRPGAFYINLKDTTEWPKWSLPTLTYHEAAPGHLFEGALAREAGDLPIYRKVGGFAAYSEGWGLYAERVADELGVYADDPFGKIGYLQSYLFRATRLVVDTGLHGKRWSREQAIRWMVDNAAEPEGSAAREIERYAVMPGQATSYKLGETVISRLRAEAEARPGFDIKRFHDAVLGGGRMPLTVLERRVRAAMA